MDQEIQVEEFQQKLTALKERFSLPDVNTEELIQAYQFQIKNGGYLMNGHHNNQLINRYLLNLDSNNLNIEYDPSLITYPDMEVYNYDGSDYTLQEIKKQLPNLYCGSQEDLLSYMRYHLKGITQMETLMLNPSSIDVSFFHTERVHLNMGPNQLIWILSETNPKNWNGDLEYFHQNHIPIHVVIQKAKTVVVLPPNFYVAMKCSQSTTLVSWSILRRNLNTLQMAIKYSDRRCSGDCYLPFPTLILDILNHEVKTLPVDLKDFLKATLKKYYDEANTKFNERITKHKINGRPPKIFQDYVAGTCETCKRDLFMHYYVSRGQYYCLDCMEIQITSSMYHYPIKYIYSSWQPFVVLTSTYSDRMKHQGCIKLICANTYVGHVDHGILTGNTNPTTINERQKTKARSKSKHKQTSQHMEADERKNRLRQKAVIEDSPMIKKNSKDISQQQSNNQSREQVLKKQQIDAEFMQLEEDNLDQPVLKKKQKPAENDWNNQAW